MPTAAQTMGAADWRASAQTFWRVGGAAFLAQTQGLVRANLLWTDRMGYGATDCRDDCIYIDLMAGVSLVCPGFRLAAAPNVGRSWAKATLTTFWIEGRCLALMRCKAGGFHQRGVCVDFPLDKGLEFIGRHDHWVDAERGKLLLHSGTL